MGLPGITRKPKELLNIDMQPIILSLAILPKQC